MPISYKHLPTEPGIYLFLNNNNDVLYVGKAKNLKNRVSSYFTNKNSLGEKTRILVESIKKIKTIKVTSELESLLLEANYIKKYNPKFNLRLTDGKAYILIRITLKDTYPSVLLARKEDDKDSLYFGPFPSSQAVKMVLRVIRRIFPYHSVANHPKRVCLYHHLDLCPCLPAFDTKEERTKYKKNIRHIVNFILGKKKTVLKELEKERDAFAKQEAFEQAREIQKKIDAIHYVTSQIHKPFEYEINPNLQVDLRRQERLLLKKYLEENNVTIPSELNRIECYDISNIQGTHAVGSMVVFLNGEKSGANYRRFKIRYQIPNKPNDFAMMSEVLQRRMKHTEWPSPDLIIVDGGKGQVTSAKKVLEEKKLDIPIIGLAKREETIITLDFKEISLPKDSPALHLIMRIRDEAHRFAITYHRKLRSHPLQ